MNQFFALSAAVLLSTAPAMAAAPTAPLPEIEQQVHCSVIFALVAQQQKIQASDAARFAPMGERGKEFFVATGLRVIDEKVVTPAGIESYFAVRVTKIQHDLAAAPQPAAALDREVAQCLPMLDQIAPLPALLSR